MNPGQDLNIAELEAIFLNAEVDDCKLADNDCLDIPVDQSTPTNKSINTISVVVQKSFADEIAELDKDLKNIISKNNSLSSIDPNELEKESVIHNGDTDSSDDEDKRNVLDQKYNDFGKHVKNLLKKQENEQVDKSLNYTFNRDMKRQQISSNSANSKHEFSVSKPAKVKEMKSDVYTDPIFGMRIINPLISSSALIERMSGKVAITLAKVKRHTENNKLETDWVIAGVIVSKSGVKTSQKGTQYSIWSISDLHDDLRTVSLFLFRNAHKNLWKTNQGTVVGILNPSVLEKRDGSKDEACLSVDNPQRIMVFGHSKDLGFCKSRKKNGDPCTSFVNTNKCEYCVFHVKQEYIQHSKRSELQSTFAGNGLQNLRNKVLGKSEVFYAGQSYSAAPLQKNHKQAAKDRGRLSLLSNQSSSGYKINLEKQDIVNSMKAANKLNASRVEVPTKQREKDLERLKILKEYMPEASMRNEELKNVLTNSCTNIEKQNYKPIPSIEANSKSFIPKLKTDEGKSFIDLNVELPKIQNRAKLNALLWVQKNGPIRKADPANLRGSVIGKKRLLTELSNDQPNKKKKEESAMTFKSDRFKKIMEATSINEHLVTQAEDEKREKYFDSLEKKEAMEEKMLNTFKLACKAVSCLKCKYTSFSASEKCKAEKHPLKVLDACKRFFQCQDCNNRTATLDKIPKFSCKNCQGSHWVKAPMLKERLIKNTGDVLSIRGDEESFIGSLKNRGNINLLVPE